MKIAIFGAALVAATCTLVVGARAEAASPATQVFLANVTPNVDFLDRSSRFALTNSKSARVHEFAFNEAREQTLAANSIDEWTQANAGVRMAGDTVMTGRSVAVDSRTAPAADMRLPMGQEDLDSLEGLAGREFDEQYKIKQRDALTQIAADYKTYIATGDDAGLIALAKRELPKIQRRLALLDRI